MAASILLGVLAACGSSPTGPTPTDPPSITCPADIEATAGTGLSRVVTFAQPPIRGGTLPLTVTCAPPSGSTFPVGDTTVTCTVADGAQRSSSCQFRVRVVSPLHLSRTSFLAFGDSITEGTIGTLSGLLMLVGAGHSYPARLQNLLDVRYPNDDIVVVNAGRGGDTTNDGRQRLPGVLAAHPDAEVLLLLMGVNAINVIPQSTQISNLRFMIRLAKGQGMDVLIATLTPISAERAQRSPLMPQRILNLNAAIEALAAQEGIAPAVDLHAAFLGRPSLLSPDGLHPNEAGYVVIAETFAEEIAARWETGGGALTVTSLTQRRAR